MNEGKYNNNYNYLVSSIVRIGPWFHIRNPYGLICLTQSCNETKKIITDCKLALENEFYHSFLVGKDRWYLTKPDHDASLMHLEINGDKFSISCHLLIAEMQQLIQEMEAYFEKYPDGIFSQLNCQIPKVTEEK